jgi:hypothetical protein
VADAATVDAPEPIAEQVPDAESFVESLPVITDFIVDSEYGEEQTDSTVQTAAWDMAPVPMDNAISTEEAGIGEVTGGDQYIQDVPIQSLPAQDLPAQDPVAIRDSEGQLQDSVWMSDERNAFDWQAVAALTTKQDDEHRATDEWSATNWESSSSDADHIAAMLIQIARQIKSGELVVAATRGMTTEATLAATLMALLQTEA